jgi:hypothetical protein
VHTTALQASTTVSSPTSISQRCEMHDVHQVQFNQTPDGEIVVNIPNVRIKLTKNAKGSYQWEISVAGNSVAEASYDTMEADNWLRKHYGSTE